MLELGTHGTAGINPEASQLRALLEADREGPLQFVNLLAYRERAVYPEGHELAHEDLSGSEAYGRYGVIASGTSCGAAVRWCSTTMSARR